MRKSWKLGAVSVALMAALGLFGCSGGDTTEQKADKPAAPQAETQAPEETKPEGEAVELQIFAANSLTKAMAEAEELYTQQNPNVTFADTQYEASGTLNEMLGAGQYADILITASKGTMDDAEAAELVDADTREDMFVNDLVIIRAEGSDTKVEAIADVANLDGKIAIGDAKTVPAGKYANQALASVGLYTGTEGDDGEYAPEIADKVALADKVGTAAAYVSTGDCVAGFVYSSDIFRYDGIEEAFVCPEDSHKPIVYPGAVAESSEHADEAKAFIDFCLTNKKAQKIWAKYGFELSA